MRRSGSAHQATPHQLRSPIGRSPISLNPLLAHDQDTIGFDLLFVETLVGLSRDNKLVPILLTRVPSRSNGDISADGRTIVYHLRPNARFADGTMLTSADVAFTYRAIMDPRNPVLSQDAYLRIESLSTPDAHTVVIRLRSPWNAAVRELFAQSDFAFGILPAHAFAGTSLQRARLGAASLWKRAISRHRVETRRSRRARTQSVLLASTEADAHRAANDPRSQCRRGRATYSARLMPRESTLIKFRGFGRSTPARSHDRYQRHRLSDAPNNRPADRRRPRAPRNRRSARRSADREANHNLFAARRSLSAAGSDVARCHVNANRCKREGRSVKAGCRRAGS